jgi:hypothetical protein
MIILNGGPERSARPAHPAQVNTSWPAAAARRRAASTPPLSLGPVTLADTRRRSGTFTARLRESA